MKGLFRKRGGGKTTALVYTSAITGYPIVVPTTISKRYVKAEEIIRAYAAEHFNAPVIAYTITVDGDGDSA